MKIAITGATGLIGTELTLALARQGHDLTLLTRDVSSASHLPGRSVQWTPSSENSIQSLCEILSGVETVVHLAGHPVADQRWDESTKQKILESRVLSTKYIVSALNKIPDSQRPKNFICGSAIGIYGDRADEELTENSSTGTGFLADVVEQWEKEALAAEKNSVRVTLLRTGVVLSKNGGALKKAAPVVVGSGNQWMSWIHIQDVVRLIQFCIENKNASGPINVTAPIPARNKLFTHLLAEAKHQPLSLSAPEIILKVALGEMSHVLLDSTQAVPEKALRLGFKFQYPTLKEALGEIYSGLNSGESRFSAVQFIPKKKEEIFEFFAKAENLEKITPPWLNFKIIKKSTVQIQEQTLIDYRLKIHGVPIYWKTRIEEWNPPNAFVDTQLKGPYSKWRHTHRFEDIPGGTLMWDDVIYKLPAGFLGNLFGSPLVKKDVNTIFEYRKKIIQQVFSS